MEPVSNAEREKKIAEIISRWYKDPTLISPAQNVARQAFHDVRFLLSELDYWKGYGEESLRIEKELRDRLQSIQQERDEIIQTIRPYGDPQNYNIWPSPLWMDGGQKIRDLLQKMGVGEERT
ncbi:hypothetical protein [Paenibacillus sp. GYB003]|uniref:hypothetical protein n=1 Tax=Paenibacillus sp. GYB003 TaxID=2994392 RepID=UPI002F96BA4D